MIPSCTGKEGNLFLYFSGSGLYRRVFFQEIGVYSTGIKGRGNKYVSQYCARFWFGFIEKILMKTVIEDSIKSFVNDVINRFDPERVILFGSHASGRATPDSDVDILGDGF